MTQPNCLARTSDPRSTADAPGPMTTAPKPVVTPTTERGRQSKAAARIAADLREDHGAPGCDQDRAEQGCSGRAQAGRPGWQCRPFAAGALERVYLSPLPSWLLASAGRVVTALLPAAVLIVTGVGYSLIIAAMALVEAVPVPGGSEWEQEDCRCGGVRCAAGGLDGEAEAFPGFKARCKHRPGHVVLRLGQHSGGLVPCGSHQPQLVAP